MRKANSKSIVIGILCCMLVFMGVGYATLQQVLNISGTGNITGSFDIYIKSIVLDTQNTNTSSENITFMQDAINLGITSATSGHFSSKLLKPGDYVTFDITIENRGTIDAFLSTYTRTATPDSQLSNYLNGASYNTFFTMSNPFDDESKRELASGESVVYSVRVDFMENATSIPDGKLDVELELNYIQKAALNNGTNNEGSGGSSGGNQGSTPTVPNFTLDENGIIVAYDESQVIDNDGYAVVGATNSDGDQITGVNSNSFIKSNVTIYTETDELSLDEIVIYVVEDEENFNSIKGVIEGAQQTSSKINGISIQKLGTTKVRIIGRSEYTGTGVGVRKLVNTTTRQITDPQVIITKLDLSGASNITSIPESVLQNAGLTHLKLGSSITSIGANAFKGNSLTTITIPANVTAIGDNAFSQNSFADSSAITIEGNTTNVIDRFNERWTIIGFPGSGPIYVEPRPVATDASCFTFDSTTGTITAYKTTTACPKDVVIPDEINDVPVTKIGASAFRSKSLISVFIPYGIEEIQDGTASAGAFTSNVNLKSITFENTKSNPSHLKKIGRSAFRSASTSYKLTGTLTIPASVETIGASAFYYSKYSSLIIENTSSKKSKLTTIENNAFAVASGVKEALTGELIIPASVTTIGDYAFRYQHLTSLIFEDEDTEDGHSKLTKISINAFQNNELTTLTIPASVTSIAGSTTSNGAFKGNLFETAEDITVKFNETNLITRFNKNWNNIGFPGEGVTKPLDDTCFTFDSSTGTITAYDSTCPMTLVIPSTIGGVTVTTIGAGAFRNKSLKSVTIPYTVTQIGGSSTSNGAFASNSTLSTVIFEDTQEHPSQLTTIGSYAFYSCKLTNLTLPATVVSIGSSAFNNNRFDNSRDITIGYNENNLITRFDSLWYSIGFPDDKYGCFYVRHGENSTITNYDSTCTKDVVIPSIINQTTVTKIGDNAFMSKQLTSVEIPNTVTSMGVSAFRGNYLTEVTIPSSVSTISNQLFYNNLIENITIPASVTTIGIQAFSNNQLTSVTIPNTVRYVSNYAFQYNHIQTVNFESGTTSLTELNTGVFSNNDITNIVIPEGIQRLGGLSDTSSYGVFASNSIETISLPSTLQIIGAYAFYNNALTGTTVVPASVYRICDSAYDSNANLSTIVVKRTDDTGMTLGTSWNGSANVIWNPNYGE